jgi:D-beta-D-heptose 7-phosphate kinase / D-beta-D-heptose 1-phosphate adenosyltransferase
MKNKTNIKNNPRILVIGDILLDEYVFGEVSRISPEAPVPILKYSRSEYRLGGAANVGATVAAFGIEVTLLGISGIDESGEILQRRLKEENVTPHLVRSTNCMTILKKRVIANNQQLLRIDNERTFDSDSVISIKSKFKEIYKDYDLVILSDYGKGTLVDHKYYIDASIKSGIPILIDPKGGDFDKYSGASLITPNLREFEEIMGPSSSRKEFLIKVKKLKKQLKLTYIVVTLGADGMLLVDIDDESTFFKAKAKKVFDVSGAGDTVIAILASLMAKGENVSKALNIANVAAGIAVGKVGTCIVTKAEIDRELSLENNSISLETNFDHLLEEIKDLKERGQKLVMTNGCFDLLHSGHIDLLKKSKAMGDILIVALNRDDSIARLKGNSRPINNFESRVEMLASLKFVDYVVGFDDDTPEKLYSQLLPDVLVKGSDYINKEVVGADAIVKNGGKVEFVSLIEGFSSTKIIEKILNDNK